MTNVPENELFSAYLDGEATADERAQVEQWLASSAEARRLMDELRAAGEAVRAVPALKINEDLSERVLRIAERRMLTEPASPNAAERAEDETPGSPFWRILRQRLVQPRIWIWSGVAAAAAILLTFVNPLPENRTTARRFLDESPVSAKSAEHPGEGRPVIGEISAVPGEKLAAESLAGRSVTADGLKKDESSAREYHAPAASARDAAKPKEAVAGRPAAPALAADRGGMEREGVERVAPPAAPKTAMLRMGASPPSAASHGPVLRSGMSGPGGMPGAASPQPGADAGLGPGSEKNFAGTYGGGMPGDAKTESRDGFSFTGETRSMATMDEKKKGEGPEDAPIMVRCFVTRAGLENNALAKLLTRHGLTPRSPDSLPMRGLAAAAASPALPADASPKAAPSGAPRMMLRKARDAKPEVDRMVVAKEEVSRGDGRSDAIHKKEVAAAPNPETVKLEVTAGDEARQGKPSVVMRRIEVEMTQKELDTVLADLRNHAGDFVAVGRNVQHRGGGPRGGTAYEIVDTTSNRYRNNAVVDSRSGMQNAFVTQNVPAGVANNLQPPRAQNLIVQSQSGLGGMKSSALQQEASREELQRTNGMQMQNRLSQGPAFGAAGEPNTAAVEQKVASSPPQPADGAVAKSAPQAEPAAARRLVVFFVEAVPGEALGPGGPGLGIPGPGPGGPGLAAPAKSAAGEKKTAEEKAAKSADAKRIEAEKSTDAAAKREAKPAPAESPKDAASKDESPKTGDASKPESPKSDAAPASKSSSK